MTLDQLTYQIHNNVISGLKAMSVNSNHSITQIEDMVIEELLTVIREYSIKGILPKQDFYRKINCIEITCGTLEECCTDEYNTTPVQTFEIPELITDFGNDAISFIGSVDLSTQYRTYLTLNSSNNQKYRMRGAEKPYVLIDPSTIHDGFYTGKLFNAPLVKRISIIGMFKDPRKLTEYDCCSNEVELPNSFINTDVVKNVTEKMIRWYRQFAVALHPNDQAPKP